MNNQIWLEQINQNVQKLLANSSLGDIEVELRGHSDLSLEIVIDGEVYQDLDKIANLAVRNLLKSAIDEWQNEAEADPLVRGVTTTQRPTWWTANRKGMVVWLVTTILVLIVPLRFITPPHMAIRFGLLWTGSMIGGLLGALLGKGLGQRVAKGKNPGTRMFLGILGGAIGIPLGFMTILSIISLIP